MSCYNLRDRQTEIAIYILFKCEKKKQINTLTRRQRQQYGSVCMREKGKIIAYLQAPTGNAAVEAV